MALKEIREFPEDSSPDSTDKILMQTSAGDITSYSQIQNLFVEGIFKIRRVSQEAEPTPAVGELMMWYKPTGSRVRLIYNDTDAGVVSVQLN